MLFVRLGQGHGRLSVQAQDQHTGFAGPAVAGVLPYAVHKGQAVLAQLGFQRVLAGLVFCGAQRLAPGVPCGDEGSARTAVLRHQRHQLRAGLPYAQGERGFALHGVVGFAEGLHQVGCWVVHGGSVTVHWPAMD